MPTAKPPPYRLCQVVANSLSRVRSMRGQDVGLSVEEQVQQVSPALQQQDPPAQQQQQQQQWAMDPSPAAATALAPAQLSTLEERWMSFFEDPEGKEAEQCRPEMAASTLAGCATTCQPLPMPAWTDLRQMKRDNQVKPRSPDFKKKNGGEGQGAQ